VIIQRSDDPVFRQLAGMTPLLPDATHRAGVRARCHAALARQRRHIEAETRAVKRRSLEFAGIGTFTVVYVAVVIHDMLASYGVWTATP